MTDDGSVELVSDVSWQAFDFHGRGVTTARSDGSATSTWQGPADLTFLCSVAAAEPGQALAVEATFGSRLASARFESDGSVVEFHYRDPDRGFAVSGEASARGFLALRTFEKSATDGILLQEASMSNFSPTVPSSFGPLVPSDGGSALDSALLHSLGGDEEYERLVALINGRARILPLGYVARTEQVIRDLGAALQFAQASASQAQATRDAAAAQLAAATEQSNGAINSQLESFFGEVRSMISAVMSSEFHLASRV